ncbi:MAG: glycosyltransferase family 2 protein, partial [Mariprofundaceae bacterium]|nr:glycosyltransferase family 2 protein [Mariprofundaceae bacterium]
MVTMIERITPVILTYNEEANIRRTLEALHWASDIVVVDSFSTDRTLDILAAFANARVFQRQFDKHAKQWNYAISETDIQTEWVLALDADYVVTPPLLDELKQLEALPDIAGYRADFRYCIEGKPLRGTLYPPVTVLFRKSAAKYVQDGHTQRVVVNGRVGELSSCMLHDDRKSLSSWLQAQNRYMTLEAELLCKSAWRDASWPDRL